MQDNIEAVVKGEGLIKTFKDFWGRDKVKALRGVDIVIPKGSVFGLLGPNGAGKSTLIKLILGHLYPSSGRLLVLGKDPKDVEIKYKLGYLPERSYLYKNLTAEETLYYFGEILNLSKEQIKSRTDQLLEMVGLQNAKKRYVGEFSHGMTRRMGLAQALLNDPDFIILDEPTAGLDPVGCREVKDLIVTLGKRGKTVLLTSHLLADVEDTCDELLMMYGGTVQSKGKVDELLADTNKIKIEFPADKNIDINIIENELRSKSGSAYTVTSPRQSLEQYFLNIVNKGQESKETSGAQQGKGVAAYLKAGVKETPKTIKKDLEGAPEVKEPINPKPIDDSLKSPEKNLGTNPIIQDSDASKPHLSNGEEKPSSVKEESSNLINDEVGEDKSFVTSSSSADALDPVAKEQEVESQKPILQSQKPVSTELANEQANYQDLVELKEDSGLDPVEIQSEERDSEFSELKASSLTENLDDLDSGDIESDEDDADLDEELLDDLTI